MPSPSAGAWLHAIDFDFVDRRFGAGEVNRALAADARYVGPLELDEQGRLRATVEEGRSGQPYLRPETVVLRVRPSDLEMSCTCSRGRSFLCRHVMTILVDAAVHRPLREALTEGSDARVTLDDLPAARFAALEHRSLDERLAHWLPAASFDTGFELDVEVRPSAGLPTAEPRPALFLRHRRPPSRVVVKPREIVAARLEPRHRRLVELSAPSNAMRDALVATGAQASLLVHLLRDEPGAKTRAWKAPLRFSDRIAEPRIERIDDRLWVRFYDADEKLLFDARGALLFTGPFPYVWNVATETFHAVDPAVDLDLLWGLMSVPSLPLRAEDAARIGRQLLERTRGLGVRLPPPEAFGLPPIEIPTFTLRIEGSPLDLRAVLTAHYGEVARVVSRSDPRADYMRNAGLEGRALELLADAGLRPNDGEQLTAEQDDAVFFWRRGLDRLRRRDPEEAPRIDVFVSEALTAPEFVGDVEVEIDVRGEPGWLEVDATFQAKALKVEMAKLRLALMANRRWILLGDRSLARISDKITALVEEAESAGLTAAPDGHLRGRWKAHGLGRALAWSKTYPTRLAPEVSKLSDELRHLATTATPSLPADLTATLRPYQARGVAWLQFLRRMGSGGILADDMGLGKTLMTLAFLARWKEDEGAAPSLVVCPTSLIGNWAREASRFTPSLRVLTLTGAQETREAALAEVAAADVVVTSYALLRRDQSRLAPLRFRAVVLDEAQNIKSDRSLTARAAGTLVAQMRLALSGTPVENRLDELWSIMSFANPGMLGTKEDFEQRFERPLGMRPDGALAEHLRGILRPFVLRRTKSEVLVDLPSKIEVEKPCQLEDHQRRLYDALAFTLRESVKKNLEKRGLARSRISVLTAILRLRQMACDPRLVDASAPAEASAKRSAFLELARELAASGRRALVFSQFVGLFDLWRRDLDREQIRYEYLDGRTRERDAVVDRFQSGDATLFLVSLKAGGAGLNLTAADTVIHCDPWWNPAAEDQATDRAHRIGQSKSVTVVRLYAEGTIESKIVLLKRQKRELTESLFGGSASALPGLREEDLPALFEPTAGDALRVDPHLPNGVDR